MGTSLLHRCCVLRSLSAKGIYHQYNFPGIKRDLAKLLFVLSGISRCPLSIVNRNIKVTKPKHAGRRLGQDLEAETCFIYTSYLFMRLGVTVLVYWILFCLLSCFFTSNYRFGPKSRKTFTRQEFLSCHVFQQLSSYVGTIL